MLKKYSILITLIGLITFTSCEKDFSLNGTYKRTPVIFGLIDQSDSIHMIRITRTYLGDGDNHEYAQIADSSYFDQVDAKVYEVDGLDTIRSWQLHDTLINNKEAGLFYGPEQKMYTFFANDLNEEFEYKFEGIFDEGKYDANAGTELISGFGFIGTWLQSATSNPEFRFAGNLNSYLSVNPKATTPKNVAIKSTKLIINYIETYADNSFQNKSIIWTKQDDFENVSLPSFAGEEFYNLIAKNVSIDENVIKREMINATLRVVMVDEFVSKYIDASAPATSISQAKPRFTNINRKNNKDGALGIFSARHIRTKTLPFNAATIENLCKGDITGNLGFCSSLAAHVSENFYCP